VFEHRQSGSARVGAELLRGVAECAAQHCLVPQDVYSIESDGPARGLLQLRVLLSMFIYLWKVNERKRSGLTPGVLNRSQFYSTIQPVP
jgi:hypothetical protein